MASYAKLDAAGRASRRQLISTFLLLAFCATTQAQQPSSDNARLTAAQKAFDSGQWEQTIQLSQAPNASADLDFLRGLALAKQQRWQDSRQALLAGHLKQRSDPRFLVELAGVDYKRNDFASAKRELCSALQLNSKDRYTLNFLATIYFVEGNLEAALKYWNAIDKPRLRKVAVQPPPRLDAKLLDRAITFNAPQILTAEELLATQKRIVNLGVFSRQRLELAPSGQHYDATLHVAERNGRGDSKLEGALALLSGLPYDTVYPEFYNLANRAINVTSLLRWDSQKRRAFANLSTPVFDNPARRFQIYFDARNENWNLIKTYFAGGSPLGDLNLLRLAGGIQLHSVVNASSNWSTGVEVAARSFRNVPGITTPKANVFFPDAASFTYWLRADRTLLRIPERRLTLDASSEGRLARTFARDIGASGTARASVDAQWLPRASGDDYETRVRLRAGATVGNVPFDELFQLGIERDNDLWMRGHAGTTGGRKGAAPLGRRYLLANWDTDKNIYNNGLFTVKLGPFVDSGRIADPSGLFGSREWMWDTGAQCKVQVLGSLTVLLIYGRDLRGGRNVFFGTVLR